MDACSHISNFEPQFEQDSNDHFENSFNSNLYDHSASSLNQITYQDETFHQNEAQSSLEETLQSFMNITTQFF